MASNKLVLVTGGSGFLAAHCIVALFAKGYRVRTTLRSMKRADEVRSMIKAGGASEAQAQSLEFATADLANDDGWTEACTGCHYVLHVASPFPPNAVKNADELMVPAREGTLRALRAAKHSGTVKRVVITSSVAAIVYGHPERQQPFTEDDWSELEHPATPVGPYQQSKTIAERAAWDWMAKEGGQMELTVVNPVGIYGPVLGKDYAASIELVVRMLNGQLPGLPRLTFGVVDVRDTAEIHLLAMTHPKAAGERFIAVSDDGFISTQEIAQKIKARLGDKAKKVPTRNLPDFLLRLVGYFDSTVALVIFELGKKKDASNAKAKTLLGWQPRSAEDALVATAESCYKFGLVK